MPPPLPSRYRLDIRLGRDGDIEEWLATDLDLDRPVLVRVLGPDISETRQERFLRMVQEASRVSHNHIAAIYSASQNEGSTYAVTEWVGGVTLADRIEAGETPPIAEFLSNAAGLADGLAALHDEGVYHGGIDSSSILYARAHPAKLGGFGRKGRRWSERGDVEALGAALEEALTGHEAGVLPPSQMIDALPPAVDDSLRLAQRGQLEAHELADQIRSIPYSAPLEPTRTWSWRWLVPTGLLAVVAALFVWLGTILDSGPSSPILFPSIPSSSTTAVSPTTSTLVDDPTGAGADTPTTSSVSIDAVIPYDPLGDGEEQPGSIPNLIDGDSTTTWRTERYFDPLPLLKSGVGVAFEISGIPSAIEIVAMSEGTMFQVLWTEQLPDEFEGWETIATGTSLAGNSLIQLPGRRDGVWLIWMTDMPQHAEGYFSEIAEVRFHT